MKRLSLANGCRYSLAGFRLWRDTPDSGRMSLWSMLCPSKERWGAYLEELWLDPRLYHKEHLTTVQLSELPA